MVWETQLLKRSDYVSTGFRETHSMLISIKLSVSCVEEA